MMNRKGVTYSVVVDQHEGTVRVTFKAKELQTVASRPLAQGIIAAAMWDAANELLAVWARLHEVTE